MSARIYYTSRDCLQCYFWGNKTVTSPFSRFENTLPPISLFYKNKQFTSNNNRRAIEKSRGEVRKSTTKGVRKSGKIVQRWNCYVEIYVFRRFQLFSTTHMPKRLNRFPEENSNSNDSMAIFTPLDHPLSFKSFGNILIFPFWEIFPVKCVNGEYFGLIALAFQHLGQRLDWGKKWWLVSRCGWKTIERVSWKIVTE